ncbi:MAG: hypothetical protein M0R06_00760 [Sphaerochaeta sp.]|jgi:hypothetical protein|nr:hypothetical protein [Sphaerochaeta sp.]
MGKGLRLLQLSLLLLPIAGAIAVGDVMNYVSPADSGYSVLEAYVASEVTMSHNESVLQDLIKRTSAMEANRIVGHVNKSGRCVRTSVEVWEKLDMYDRVLVVNYGAWPNGTEEGHMTVRVSLPDGVFVIEPLWYGKPAVLPELDEYYANGWEFETPEEYFAVWDRYA